MTYSEILYEDNHLIIVNKKGGSLVHSDKTGDRALDDDIKSYLKIKYNKPGNVFLGIIHRLDRPVSGVIVFAKTSKSLARMNEAFRARKVKKTYWAIVRTAPPLSTGLIELKLKKNQNQNKSYVVSNDHPSGKMAELHYHIIASYRRYYLLEIEPITGRHHQIRALLSHIGSPIIGDLKYGAERSNPDGCISLHSRQIEFIHPVSRKPMSIKADTPDDTLWQSFKDIA